MKLQNEKFRVNVLAIKTGGLDFNEYDLVYFKENAKDEFSKSHIITVDNGDVISKITLVGDLFLYDEHCAVLEDSVLTVLQNKMLVQIDLNTCQMIKQKPIEEFGGNFQLHVTPAGYLVYGESTVATYDKELDQIWRFSGKDIFFTVSGKTAFKLGTDTIRLYDFEDNFYVLDFNGKLISQKHKSLCQ